MSVPERYLDRIETAGVVPVLQGAPTGAGAGGGVMIPGPTEGDESRKQLTQREMVRHYTEWTYVAVSRIVNRCSQVQPMIGRIVRKKPEERQRFLGQKSREHLGRHYGVAQSLQEDFEPLQEDHPFRLLLQNPNEYQTFGEFSEQTFLFWLLTGDFYWLMESNSVKRPRELHVLETHFVTRSFDSGEHTGYEYAPEGYPKPIEYSLEEVLHGKFTSPLGRHRSHSALSSGSRWIDNAEIIEKSRSQSFKSGPNPSAAIQLGEKYQNPEQSEINEIKRRIMQRMSGYQHHGEPVVIPHGIEMKPWSRSPKEMDYERSAEQLRDNILSLWGVPPVIAGITADYTRATAEAAEYVFCDVTINPALRRFAYYLTDLGRMFDPNIFVFFQSCTPNDPEQALKDRESDFKMGALSPDERRVEAGREPVGTPLYNTGYVGGSLMPLSDDLQPEEI